MSGPGRKIPGEWVKWLEGEAAAWVKEELIEQQLADAILQRYQEIQPTTAEASGNLVTVLAVMGALLLGIGVILFFAANWQMMSKLLKTTIVMGSILIAYGVGYYLVFEKQNFPRVGRSLVFLGSILYGAGIWLIAQIFHISSHYPNGVLLWALGILPMVLICHSQAILVEVSLLFILWTILEQTGFASTNLLYLPLFCINILLCFKLQSRLAIGITLSGFIIWLAIASGASFVNTDQMNGIPYSFFLIALTGLLLNTIVNLPLVNGVLSEWRLLMMLPGRIVGLSAFFLALYVLSFRSIVRIFADGSNIPLTEFFIIVFSFLALVTLAVGIYVVVKSGGSRGRLPEGIFAVITVFILFILAFFVSNLGEKIFTLTTNLLLFFAVVFVVVAGYNYREPALVNIGLLFFVLDVIARYFDFFWDMLPRSVFFMAGGLLLILGGILLERQRRKMVREMQVKNYAG